MKPESLVQELRRRGVRLWEEEGRLRWRSAKGVMTPALTEALRQQKERILATLAEPTSTTDLFAWATELAKERTTLTEPVSYLEAPKRRVTTGRVSWYAAHYMTTIADARHGQTNRRVG